jgi:hypothetical protein
MLIGNLCYGRSLIKIPNFHAHTANCYFSVERHQNLVQSGPYVVTCPRSEEVRHVHQKAVHELGRVRKKCHPWSPSSLMPVSQTKI